MNDLWQFSLPGWPPVQPDVRGRNRFFGLGEVRLAVLSMIEESPKHGYQLMKELASRLGSLYRVGSGTVYPVLKQLEQDALVQCRMKEGRKIYSLTRAGRKLLAGEAESVNGIWRRAAEAEDLGQHVGPHSMAVVGPLSELYSVTLRAAAWTGGNPDREDQVRSILRRAAADLTELMPQAKKHR
jgi:DNA-binding PadR family transcriptional regulator